MSTEVIIALIAVIITGIGVAIAVFFNIRATRQNTKSQYYQIMKDLEERFHQIRDLTENDLPKYAMHTCNFAQFMVELIDQKIVPKKMVYPNYQPIFGEALWILNNITNKEIKKDCKEFLDFCNENDIKEERISKSRLSKNKLYSESLSSLIFSSDENKDADIYTCPICRYMFKTKKELAKHKKEAKCKPKSD